MRAKNLENIASTNPYTLMLEGGATPGEIKQFVIEVLSEYVEDKSILESAATSLFAAEAIRIGRIVGNPEWKLLFEKVLGVRNELARKIPELIFDVHSHFQPMIEEAERNFTLIVNFERRTRDLDLEDFAFEVFRNIGAIVESVIQPFVKEFCALLMLKRHGSVNISEVENYDLGKAVASVLSIFSNEKLLTLGQHEIRINQWRNIAQHHAYVIKGQKICMKYGKTPNQKEVLLSREELLASAHEIVNRLSIFKASRELLFVNNRHMFRSLALERESSISDRATLLAAAMATQGFQLNQLVEHNDIVLAEISDLAPHLGERREIHCSQFVLVIGQSFWNRSVEIRFSDGFGQRRWRFFINHINVKYLLELESPYSELINRLEWECLKGYDTD